MGKPWLLYKAAAAGDGKSSSAGKSRKRGGDRHTPSSSSFGGCMNAVFNLFDIQHHHHHLPFISDSSINIPEDQPNIILKGVEAPRNSLEVEEASSSSSSSAAAASSLKLKLETNFKIPMRDIQINTKRSKLMEDMSSECSSSSPGTKTPTLVARLMGLDLLPEGSSPRQSLSSPRVSSSSSHATPLNPLSKLSSNKYNTTRSLPATPRASTGVSRPSTEADYHHRLSLQIIKENKRRYDENSSEYAKQIAKQVRENISRRVAGADITNTVKKKEHRRDEFLVVLKPNRPSPTSTAAAMDRARNIDKGHGFGRENYEPTHLSCSARIRLLEIKNNLNKSNSSLRSSPLLSSSSDEAIRSSSSTQSPALMKQEKPLKMQKCKKIASEKYDLRLKKMHQQEEACMKKCNKKSTPLSNHLVKVNTTTKFISFKKDMASFTSSSTTMLPQKQNIKETHKLSFQDEVSTNGNGIAVATTTTTAGSSNSDYFEYISRILSHTGIENTTPISISHWYSPSHPLHPSIFHQIETHFHPAAGNSGDRKLIFAVVDELLVEILKPYISLKPWAALGQQNSHRMCGSELIGILSEKIRCFPAADCQVLEDIDGLIEKDMRNSTRMVGEMAFAEEAEELVAEMERDMVDTLVGEMAGLILHVG